MPYEIASGVKIPASVKAFAIASLQGATHTPHIDSDGFGTVLVGECGVKIILVGTPVDETLFSVNKRYKHNSWSLVRELLWQPMVLLPGVSMYVFCRTSAPIHND